MPELMLSREGLTQEALEAAVRQYDEQSAVSRELGLFATAPETAGTHILKKKMLRGANEIAEAEFGRSHSQSVEGFSPADAPYEELGFRMLEENRALLATVGSVNEREGLEDKLQALDLFLSCEEAPNLTIDRVRMNGDWRAADHFEDYLAYAKAYLGTEGYNVQEIDRASAEARKKIKVRPQLVSTSGFIAVERKRRMLIASKIRKVKIGDDFIKMREEIELNKIAGFNTSIDGMVLENSEVSAELRTIAAAWALDKGSIATNFFVSVEDLMQTGLDRDKAITAALSLASLNHLKNNLGAVGRREKKMGDMLINHDEIRGKIAEACISLLGLGIKMEGYKISSTAVIERLQQKCFDVMKDPASNECIEQEIKAQEASRFLLPAVTTMWASRKYTKIAAK